MTIAASPAVRVATSHKDFRTASAGIAEDCLEKSASANRNHSYRNRKAV
jgi:hypothetical protein